MMTRSTIIQAKQYTLEIQPILVPKFNDLGVSLTEQFKILYHTYFTQGRIQLTQDFIKASEAVFSQFTKAQLIALGDAYFNNFTVITENLLAKGQYGIAFGLWTGVLQFIRGWEKRNKKKLHKGTPYYFSAVSSILQNDFDAGLMAMQNALKEDKRNIPKKWHKAPGYHFMSLNDQEVRQYFRTFVVGMVGFIRDRLDGRGNEQGRYKVHYRARRAGKLTYDQLRSKFLDDKTLDEDIRFYFVYAIIRIWHLRRLQKNKVGDDLMAPLISTNTLFDLLLVLDELLKKWDNPTGNRWKFSKHIHKLGQHERWINSSTNIRQYSTDLDLRSRVEQNFDEWCKELVGKSSNPYKTKSGREVTGLEADFVLAYGLRNFSAHTIKSQSVICQNYTEILQSILNCLFKAIELL